jgi:hypothetical protein
VYKFGFSHVFSVDERGFSYVQKSASVIDVKKRLGLPQVLIEDVSLSRGIPSGSIYEYAC